MSWKDEEKVIKHVEAQVNKAIRAERKRILDGLKELKAEFQEIEDKVLKQGHTKALTAANKVVRDQA